MPRDTVDRRHFLEACEQRDEQADRARQAERRLNAALAAIAHHQHVHDGAGSDADRILWAAGNGQPPTVEQLQELLPPHHQIYRVVPVVTRRRTPGG